jgi:hypothetical protein
VVAGNGLGPDLRTAVPFVMARRTAPKARFVAIYEAYRDTPVVKSVVESAAGVFVVTMAGSRDEISVTPGKFRYQRTESRN